MSPTFPGISLGEPRLNDAAPQRHQRARSPGPTMSSVGLAPSGSAASPVASALGSARQSEHHVAASPSGTTAGFVPVEVANERLWAVTTEYENLLRLQKEHQLLTAQRREAEVRHLKAIGRMLSGESTDEESIAARMQAREEEVAMTQKAKQAELELLGALLVLRDRQTGELQRMCEAKREQIRRLQQHSNASHGSAEEHGGSWSEVERLRARVLHMESAVHDKRGELRTLAGTLDAKTQRAAELQAEVAEAERQVGNLAGSPAPWQHEHVESIAMPHHREHADAGLAPSANLQARVEATCKQLAHTQMALGQMVRSHAHNDHLVRGMTSMGGSGMTSLVEERLVESSLMGSDVSDSQRLSPPNSVRSDLQHLGMAATPATPHVLVSTATSRLDAAHGSSRSSPKASVRDYRQDVTAHPGTRARTPSPLRRSFDEPWHLYQPYPHDPLDAVVAKFVNQPRNRLRRSLFSRTNAGQYLYGTRKALLRLNPEDGCLEAKEVLEHGSMLWEGEEKLIGWTPIEEFTRCLERTQSSRLRRARERGAGYTAQGI